MKTIITLSLVCFFTLTVGWNFSIPVMNIHPLSYHYPVEISSSGDTIILEDGSLWLVDSKDWERTKKWSSADIVLLTPNKNWFSEDFFCMTNTNIGNWVGVNLQQAPDPLNSHTHSISAIDYAEGRIYLEEGSCWSVTPWNWPYLGSASSPKWMVGDTIIVGINDRWDVSYHPNILINTKDPLNWCRVKFVSSD